MRHLIPLFIASFFVGPVVGQITITSDDMPQPDVTYPLVTAAITDMGLGEQTGADVTWDASDLIPLTDAPVTPVNINDASISAALVFNSPFNSTYQCDFFLPTEFPDLGMDLGIPLEGFNNFYQSSGDAYSVAGVGLSAMGFDLPITYDDIDEIIPLPLEYGASMTSTGAFQLELTGILSYGLDQEREVEVDGWGTLILPSGSYEVLRTRTYLTATDDVFIEQLGEPFTIDREQVTYQWWGAGMGFPLLEITEVFGLPLTATYQDLASTNQVASLPQGSEFLPYPNPVNRGEHIQWETSQPWELFDGTGRRIQSGQSNGFTVPTALVPGAYTLHVRGECTTRLLIQ